MRVESWRGHVGQVQRCPAVPHGFHQGIGLVAIEPLEVDGLQQRRHLPVGHLVPQVGADEFLPLAWLDAAAVPLPFHQVIGEHSAESGVWKVH